MADSNYILATVHPGNAADAAPIPIRERSGMHASTAMGHAVRLADWGLLLEMAEERVYGAIAERFDVYPHGAKFPSYNQLFDLPTALVNVWPSWTVNDGRKYATTYLDPSWDFAPERLENGQQYGYSPFRAHALEFFSTTIDSSRPRALDDLRRRYYDLKHMHRIVVPRRYVNLTEDWWQGFGYNQSWVSPREYTWADGSCGPVTVDFTDVFHPDVASHEGFTATPRYVLGQHFVFNADAEDEEDYGYYLTCWLPISSTGVVDTSKINPSGCRAVYEREIGLTPPGSHESWVRGTIWHGQSNDLMVVYDVTWPNDHVLVPWQWEPTN